MIILAFDPGGTTGYAVYDSDDNTCLELGQFETWSKVKRLLHAQAGKAWFPPDVVIYETFRIFPSVAKSLSWQELLAPQVIGVIRYLCQEQDILCVEQGPSVRKSGNKPCFGEHPRTVHEKDALQHAIAYARRTSDSRRNG